MPPIQPAAVLHSASRSPCTRQQLPRCIHLYHRPRPAASAPGAIIAVVPSNLTTRHFHSTPPRPKHHKPKHKSLSHADLQKLVAERSAFYKSYTEDEKAHLRRQYTPAQMAAIEAGEAAIPASDLATQARLRRDPLQFQYLDDFSRIEPTIDKKISKIRGEGQDYEHVMDFAEIPSVTGLLQDVEDAVVASERRGSWERNDEIEMDDESGAITESKGPEMVFKQDKHAAVLHGLLHDPEYDAAVKAAVNKVEQEYGSSSMQTDDSEAPDAAKDEAKADAVRSAQEAVFQRFYNLRLAELETAEPPLYNRYSDPLEAQIDKLLDFDSPDVAPDIPKLQDPSVRWGLAEDEMPELGIEEETLAAYGRVAKQMGQTVEQLRKYRVKTLVMKRVVNQTRLGKIQSMYFLCVAGNERGMVGMGEGKAAESPEALRMAQLNAIRSMVPILRYENRTIYGEVKGKSGAVEVKLSARQPGFGVRCSEKIFEIARCAGLADLQAKVIRKARNPMNVAKAVWQALRSQRDPDEVARGRGKKLVDVRKVYYSGLQG